MLKSIRPSMMENGTKAAEGEGPDREGATQTRGSDGSDRGDAWVGRGGDSGRSQKK